MKLIWTMIVASTLLLISVSANREEDGQKDGEVMIESIERALVMEALNDEIAQLSTKHSTNFVQPKPHVGVLTRRKHRQILDANKKKKMWKKKRDNAVKNHTKKPGSKTGTKTVRCSDDDKSMTLAKLQEYLLTITNPNKSRGYMYIPPGESSVVEDGQLFNSRVQTKDDEAAFPHGNKSVHVEEKLLTLYNGGPEVKDFYMNLTPCTECAPKLMKGYKGHVSKRRPVTIHVSRLWTGRDKDKAYEKCLAKMIHRGFKFVLMDWDNFSKRFITNNVCVDKIKSLSKDERVEEERKRLEDGLEEAKKLAKNTNGQTIEGWCN